MEGHGPSGIVDVDAYEIHELVLIFGDVGVSRVMMYQDFQAALDGVVGLTDYSGQHVRAAYVVISPQIKVTAVVLFTISFDAYGMPDASWNIPLRHMGETGGPGPDLGAGSIRLTCFSQCPVAWHQSSMWDPHMTPGNNDFIFIRDSVTAAAMRLGLSPVEAPPAPAPAYGLSAPAAYGVPQGYAQPMGSPPPAYGGMMAPGAYGMAPGQAPAAHAGSDEVQKMQNLVKEQSLHIATLESRKEKEVAELRFMHQQQIGILEAQHAKLLSQLKALKAQSETLHEQLQAQKGQLQAMSEVHERNLLEAAQRKQAELDELRLRYQAALDEQLGVEAGKLEEKLRAREAELKSQEAFIARQYQTALEQRLEEAEAHAREIEHIKHMELIAREEKIADLEDELLHVRKAEGSLIDQGADKLLERLARLGLNFVAFHPGVGHINIPIRDMARYEGNPLAYAASKCMVTEEHYRAWLQHYNHPGCMHALSDGRLCGARVLKVETPNKFAPGESDRCSRHMGDRGIDHVLRFR